MSSGYFGEPSLGNDRRGSSRKGKKNSDKPKQPQRGLGVAQLEKIRLHGQMGSNYHPSFQTPYFNQEDVRVQTAYSSIPSPSFSYSSLPSPSFSYSSSSSSPTSYGCHPSITMGLGEYERPNFIYGDLQPTSTASSWNPGGGILETQHFMQPSVNTHLLNPQDPQQKRNKKHTSSSRGSSSQNSESSDTQEVDLELRLSI